MPGTQPAINLTPQDPIDAFGVLHKQLKRALLACTDPVTQDTIRQADDVVLKAITALNQADFHSRTEEFQALTRSVNEQLKALNQLKASIDKVIADVALVTHVIASIDSAITAAAQVFPIL